MSISASAGSFFLSVGSSLPPLFLFVFVCVYVCVCVCVREREREGEKEAARILGGLGKGTVLRLYSECSEADLSEGRHRVQDP